MGKKPTQKEFEERINKKFSGEFTVIGEYKPQPAKVLIRHNTCNYQWEAQICSLKRGTCPQCSGKIKQTTDSIRIKIDEVTNGEYELIGEYINSDTKITVRHKECGYTWGIIPRCLILQGKRCPDCQNLAHYTTERLNEKFQSITNNEYSLKSEFENINKPVKIAHVLCGHIFETSPSSFLYSDTRCPLCKDSMSKGERKIYEYLYENNINFRDQHTFEDCKYIIRLRFDIAIFDSSNNLKLLIEFDGKQHYEPIEWFGGEEGFKGVQERDGIKNQYCIDNKIKLIRIPYWEENNIYTILDDIHKYIKMNQVAENLAAFLVS